MLAKLNKYSLYATLVFLILYDSLYVIIGSSMMNFLQMYFLAVMLLNVIKYLFLRKPNLFINSLLFFALVMFVYFLRSSMDGTTMLKTVLYTSLIPAAFYSLKVTEREMHTFIWILSFVCMVALYINLNVIMADNEYVYGGGYFALVCLPLGLYNLRFSSIRNRAIWCLFVFGVVLMSLKRGDILACVLSTFVFFLFNVRKNRKKFFRYILLMLLMVFVGYYFFQYYVESSEFAQNRLESTLNGESGGRDELYTFYWNYFVHSSPEVYLFGNGFYATHTIGGIPAHNDWLEVLIDEGLLGGVCYLFMFIAFFITMLRRDNLSIKPIIITIFVIFIVKSMVSMFLFSLPTSVLMAMMGYILNPNVDRTKLVQPKSVRR